MIITIDGPAGTGKSSVTKKVAERLHMRQLDTGALYRALGFGAMEQGIDPAQESFVAQFLEKKPLDVVLMGDSFHYLLEKKDVTPFLRTQAVAHAASLISTYKSVREYLLPIQRNLGKEGLVCEGRDMGTTVFPDAECKIFLTASSHERACRRLRELEVTGTAPSLEALQKEIEERDRRDSNRELSPLKVPEGAFIIDTTTLSLEGVVDVILKHVQEFKVKIEAGRRKKK